MKKRILYLCFMLLILGGVMLHGGPAGQAQIPGDSYPWPTIPGMGGDCEAHAFERQMTCLNTYFTRMNAYYAAPTICPNSNSCRTACASNPTGPECIQCVSDCTSSAYNQYYQSEMSLNTESCGVCGAQLDFCGGARAAASNCTQSYQACGGFFVEGCWETYDACRTASGIDQCQ